MDRLFLSSLVLNGLLLNRLLSRLLLNRCFLFRLLSRFLLGLRLGLGLLCLLLSRLLRNLFSGSLLLGSLLNRSFLSGSLLLGCSLNRSLLSRSFLNRRPSALLNTAQLSTAHAEVEVGTVHPAGLVLDLHLVPGAVLLTGQLDGHAGGDPADHTVGGARPGPEVLPDRGGRSLGLHLGQVVGVRPECLLLGDEAEPFAVAACHLDLRSGLQHGAHGVLDSGPGAGVQPDTVHLVGALDLRLGRPDLLQIRAVGPDGLTMALELDPVAVLGGHDDLLAFGHALLHRVGGSRTAARVQGSGHPVDRGLQLLSTGAGGD